MLALSFYNNPASTSAASTSAASRPSASVKKCAVQPRAWAASILAGLSSVKNRLAPARPLRICRGLNRKFGEVATFKVEGEEISADELAKCNAG